MNISVLDYILGLGQCWGTTMVSFYKVLLTSLVSAVACITINTAHAEVASVYGGSDGFCGSRTANGERVNCSAMTAAHRTLPFGIARNGLSPRLRGRTDQRSWTLHTG